MGLVLLRKGSQSFIGPVFTPFDLPTCVMIVKENGCEPMLSLMCNNSYL